MKNPTRTLLLTLLFLFVGAELASAAFIRRGKITKKGNIGSYRVTVTTSNDDNGSASYLDVVATPEGDEAGAVSFEAKTPKKADPGATNFFAEFDADSNAAWFRLEVTPRGTKGQIVGETRTMVLSVKGEPKFDGPDIQFCSLMKGYESWHLEVAVFGNTDEIDTIAFNFSDFSGPEPQPTEGFMTPDRMEGDLTWFTFEKLSFEDPEGVFGEVYGTVFDMIGADGKPIGSVELDCEVLK